MFLDELPDDSEIASAQAMILRQFDLGFHPELGLTVSAVDVNVGSRLLTGEEEEPEPSLSEDRRAQEASPVLPKVRRRRYGNGSRLRFAISMNGPGINPSARVAKAQKAMAPTRAGARRGVGVV